MAALDMYAEREQWEKCLETAAKQVATMALCVVLGPAEEGEAAGALPSLPALSLAQVTPPPGSCPCFVPRGPLSLIQTARRVSLSVPHSPLHFAECLAQHLGATAGRALAPGLAPVPREHGLGTQPQAWQSQMGAAGLLHSL